MYQRRVPYLPIERLHAIQQERMHRIVRHAYQTVVEALERIRPDVAFSYGSYLEHFAAFLRDRGLRPPMPKIWACGADAMSAHWREFVTREFGCAVFANYAATETGRIGFQCERRCGFHLTTGWKTWPKPPGKAALVAGTCRCWAASTAGSPRASRRQTEPGSPRPSCSGSLPWNWRMH